MSRATTSEELTEAARSRFSFATFDERLREAVEAVARTDPNPTDPFRGLYISDDKARGLASATTGFGVDARLELAAQLLGLEELEATVLGICAAPEVDPNYGRLYAYLHDDVTRKLASPRLVMRLLGGSGASEEAILTSFESTGQLRRSGALRLLEADSQIPLADRLARIGDRLASLLIGGRLDEPAGLGRMRLVRVTDFETGREECAAELRNLLSGESEVPLVVAGPDAELLLAAALGQPLVMLDIADLGDPDLLREATLSAALDGAELGFGGLEAIEPADRTKLRRALTAWDRRLLICTSTRDAVVALGEQTTLVVEVPMPSFAERKAAWAAMSGSKKVGDVSAKFRLSISQITEAASVARQAARSRGNKNPSEEQLDFGARQASTTRLAELASRLEPAFSWNDLVLPERQLEVLRSISAYLRHRDLVLSEWGYERTVARNQGLKVLFAGESGTGKTMAGQVLAHELGLDLFRIDLATVVSKYIGETEKNLDRIFDAAEGSNAILFFDEADALFGKRSEVRDSHDRYANIEVAYLLQKMDAYIGAVILATNFRQNMDDAFLRRLDIVVDFPFPEAEDRERIWRLLLPDSAPISADVDVSFLATQFKLSGGGIRNCSLTAAFLAADEDEEIGMRQLVRAVALEYGKLGRLTLESDFERFHELIQPKVGSVDESDGG